MLSFMDFVLWLGIVVLLLLLVALPPLCVALVFGWNAGYFASAVWIGYVAYRMSHP